MTKEELFNYLDQIVLETKEPLSTVVYAVMKGNSEIKKLDIDNNAIKDVEKLYLGSIRDRIREKEEVNILAISIADDRTNVLFEYDIEMPKSLTFFKSSLNDNIPKFNFKSDSFINIDYLLIKIGDGQKSIKLLKRLSTVEVFGRGGTLLWKAEERIEKFDKMVLRLSPNFHAIYVENTYFFLDVNMLEKSHGFSEVLKKEAAKSLAKIQELGILDSIEGLIDMLEKTSFARKVVRIKNSPVIVKAIPNDKIIEFTRKHPALINKMKYSEDGNRLMLHTKVAKELFIKMLDDAYLTSQLTEENYESKAKDIIELQIQDGEN